MTRSSFVLAPLLLLGLGAAPVARSITSVAAFGDSITEGDPWVSALGDVYDTEDLGLGGERTDAGLARLRAWIAGGTGATDYVTLLEGTNDVFVTRYSEDATFANLRQMVADVEAAGLIPVVIAPPPVIAPGKELQDVRASDLAARLSASAAASGENTLGNALIESALRAAHDNCPTVDNGATSEDLQGAASRTR